MTPEPKAEPVDQADQVALPPSTCPGARQHLKTALLQSIPAPAVPQSPGFRSGRWGHGPGPLTLGVISKFCDSRLSLGYVGQKGSGPISWLLGTSHTQWLVLRWTTLFASQGLRVGRRAMSVTECVGWTYPGCVPLGKIF